jgi:hypothetical protein
MALVMCALALMPAALRAQPANEVASLNQAVAPAPSTSTLDVPITDIAASLSGRAILDKDFPGLCTHAMYGFFKVMTLNQIAAMSHGEITAVMLAQARTDLSALPSEPVASVRQTNVEDLSLAPSATRAALSASLKK